MLAVATAFSHSLSARGPPLSAFQRRPESILLSVHRAKKPTSKWIPAFAGMTAIPDRCGTDATSRPIDASHRPGACRSAATRQHQLLDLAVHLIIVFVLERKLHLDFLCSDFQCYYPMDTGAVVGFSDFLRLSNIKQ